MSPLIVPLFSGRHTVEGVIIGRLLAGYGPLESALLHCVAMAKDDLDMVLKAMYRPRGETNRIDVADAIGRPAYRELKIETMFVETVSDMRFCLKIRNQYAHCHWHEVVDARLCFINLEEIAKKDEHIIDLHRLTFHYLDEALLTQQEAYFVYVRECLLYLNYEGRFRAKRISTHDQPRPKKVRRPPPYIP
jgi:hypothetical protein